MLEAPENSTSTVEGGDSAEIYSLLLDSGQRWWVGCVSLSAEVDRRFIASATGGNERPSLVGEGQTEGGDDRVETREKLYVLWWVR